MRDKPFFPESDDGQQNGVAVRMAILYLLAGGPAEAGAGGAAA